MGAHLPPHGQLADDVIDAIVDDNVKMVCLCGCPEDEHEDHGEDGMSCGNDHFCILVWPSVRDAYVDAERRFDDANRALGAQMIRNSELAEQNRQLALRVSGLPPFGTWRGTCGHLWNREKMDESDAACPTCRLQRQVEEYALDVELLQRELAEARRHAVGQVGADGAGDDRHDGGGGGAGTSERGRPTTTEV